MRAIFASTFAAACVPLPETSTVASTPAALSVAQPNTSSIKSSSPLVEAVFATPAVVRSYAAAVAAQAQVSIVSTGKAVKVDLSGSAGLSIESGNATEGAAAATLKAYRLLSDNGQTDRSILLSELAAQSALIESRLVVDETLQKVIEAYGARAAAKETIRIIDYYLGLYNARENLVKSAVKAGVLSNSDYLELRSLKNNTLSERTQSDLSINMAESLLKNMLGPKYSSALSDLEKRYSTRNSPVFSPETSPQQKLIGLRATQLRIEIEIQHARSKPTSQWQVSVTSPQSNNSDTTVFAGVTIGLPISDGGEAAARIEALSKELIVIELDREILTQRTALAEQSWTNFLRYHQTQKELLVERKTISVERIADLELRLKAGRSDLSELAKAILSAAQTDISLARLNAEYLSQSVTAAAATGQICGLIALCKLINNGLPK